MTIQPPQTEEPLPQSNGKNGHAVVADPPATTGATTARARRAPDYRLRGLDLDAPALAEAPAGPLRKRHPSLRRRRRRLLVQSVVVLAVIAIVIVMLRAWVVEPFSVRSTSMVPNLVPGTEILVVKTSRLTGPVKTGDVIVFHEPKGSSCGFGEVDSHHLVKRVIALPGQTISSARGRIYVDGRRLSEPGWYNPPFGELGPTRISRMTIPSGSYFVMGDNRTDTCDSRAFGPVPRSLLVGKVVATIARNGHPFVHSM